MKSIRTTGILLVQIASMACACSSDNDPTTKSAATTSSGGNSGSLNTGGTTAKSTTAASTGGSSIETGGTPGAFLDAGNSDASADSAVPAAIPSIVGDYTDGYFEHRITSDTWYMDASIFHITVVNNTAEFLIALADSKNQYYPNLWNRFDWNIDSNHVLRYCETTYSAPTEQAALDTPAANAQDFANGCNGFAWSVLTPLQNGDAGTDAGH